MISPSSFSSTLESSRPASGKTEQYTTANPANLYDAELVRRFKDGDEEAFVEIVCRHRGIMFSLALRHLHNPSDAEEISQDACIHAYRGLAGFRGDSSLASWLYRIVFNLSRNRCQYFVRRHRRDTCSFDSLIGNESDTTLAEVVASEACDPARDATNREFLAHVDTCMKKLNPQQREILNLRNHLGQSYEEIAVALRINPGTVKSRIARARGNLYALLARIYGDLPPDDLGSVRWFDFDRTSGSLRIAAS